MSSHEFAEWMARERTAGPIDLGQRLDQLFAMLCAHLANIAPRDDKDRREFSPADFLPQWDQHEAEPDPATLRDKAVGIFGALRDAMKKNPKKKPDK